jgi:hypothetical protein
VRVGIATGLVVVGDLIGAGAAQEQAVVGETPNLARIGRYIGHRRDEYYLASTGDALEPAAPSLGRGALLHRLRHRREHGRRDGRALSRPHRNLTMDRGEIYRARGQAVPGNDINVGSSGSQKAPTWSPASLACLIIGQHVGPLLRLGPTRGDHHRDLGDAELPGREHPSVARD